MIRDLRLTRSAGGKPREAWSEIAAVTHWGFIKAVTGVDVPNGAALQINPT
jgi:hypothetical protein